MEKVIVSKEVAEIIEALRGVVSDITLLKIVSAECGGENPGLSAAIAIHHGYEVEETSEEKVADYYRKNRGRMRGIMPVTIEYSKCKARLEAIEFFANAYGIKIEGVNA